MTSQSDPETHLSVVTPLKANRGNRRAGKSGKLLVGHPAGEVPWRKDPVIRERIDLVWRLWAQGYTIAQAMPAVNELMRRRGVPEVTDDTVKNDHRRIKELIAEEQQDAKQAHMESFALVKREAWRAFHNAASSSLNRSAYLNTIRATEEALAKLDGSMIQRQEVVVHDGDRDLLADVAILISEDRPELAGAALEIQALDSGQGEVAGESEARAAG